MSPNGTNSNCTDITNPCANILTALQNFENDNVSIAIHEINLNNYSKVIILLFGNYLSNGNSEFHIPNGRSIYIRSAMKNNVTIDLEGKQFMFLNSNSSVVLEGKVFVVLKIINVIFPKT